MSDVYLRGLQAFGEGLDWREADVKASLVESTYRFSEEHDSLDQIPTLGDARDVWERSIPSGKALVGEDPIVFDTPYGKVAGAVVLSVGTIPIAYLNLERDVLCNGGEVEVRLPRQVFAL